MKLNLFLILALAMPAAFAKRDQANGNGNGNGNDEEEEAKKPKDKGKHLASAKLKDNSVIDFFEQDPGMIKIYGKLTGDGELEFKEQKNKKEKDEKDTPAKLYERLTGKKSKELEDAWERALISAADFDPLEEEQPAEGEEVDEDFDEDNRMLRGGDQRQLHWWVDYFCSTYPANPPSFCRCYTSRTTSTQDEIYGFEAYAEDIDAWLYPYRGGLQQNVYYWGCDSGCGRCCFLGICWDCNCYTNCYWKNFDSDYASTYEYSYIGSYNARKFYWKFTAQYGSGDGWHYSIWADSNDNNDYSDSRYYCPYVY